MDRSSITLARDVRIGEVERRFERLDTLGLLDRAEFARRLIGETGDLEPAEAKERIEQEVGTAPVSSAGTNTLDIRLRAFLNVLTVRWQVDDLTPYRSRNRDAKI